jgi:RNA recognition motif-containing protein
MPEGRPGTERVLFSMAKNIYVGNLAWGVTNEDLLELFGQYGKVRQAQVISDRETGRSRGFGFVEMEDDAEADKAIEALNGAEHNSRPLTVNVAKPREDRGGFGGPRGGGGGGPRGGGFGGGRSNFGGTDRGRRY